MYEIIECKDESESNKVYLQKSGNNHYKKYNIFGAQEVFFDSMAIILIET